MSEGSGSLARVCVVGSPSRWMEGMRVPLVKGSEQALVFDLPPGDAPAVWLRG